MRSRSRCRRSPSAEGETHELLTLNIGPHHPATHGVLRLIATLEGEVVRDIKPIIGYVHTGIEKTCEQQQYWKVIPCIERMDYLAYYFNAMAFCGAVETLLEIEVPPRAQYLRVIHLELNRIMSHLVWLGTSALDLGAMSMFWYCFRERETILDLFEMSSGQRMHTRYIQVGGVIEDIPVGFAEKVRKFVREMPTRADQYAALLEKNEIVLARLREHLHARRADAAVARRHRAAAARRRQPVGPAQGGAVLELRPLRLQDPGRHGRRQLRPLPRPPRRAVRVDEDHRAGARRAAGGAVHHARPQGRAATAPRARDLDGGADPPLQARHRGLPRAARARSTTRSRGRAASSAASSRSDGSAKPARVHMRDPSFVNLQATAPMVKDAYIADLIATLAMLDPILGGIDR